MKLEALKIDVFKKLLKDLNVPDTVDVEYLYEIYDAVLGGISQISDFATNYQFQPVNHVVVILYIVNEYMYGVNLLDKDKRESFQNDEKLSSGLASICCDKYLTNEQLNYKSSAFLNRFNPQISTLNLYLNFCLTTLQKMDIPNKSLELIKSMLFKAFSMSKCIIELLLNGFETEAFSTWRTLHENESILGCLVKYGKPMFDEYFKHITYALAYRHQITPVTEQDKVFEQIKTEMRAHDLKSKDMKKFIEYGYLYAVPDFTEKGYKLNFRDGVEKVCGLGSYSKLYEMSSEIAHSSPLLLFSQREYFFNLTLINLYETFFRIESLFAQYFNIYSKPEEVSRYKQLKTIYMQQIETVYKNIKNKFLSQYAQKMTEEQKQGETKEEVSD